MASINKAHMKLIRYNMCKRITNKSFRSFLLIGSALALNADKANVESSDRTTKRIVVIVALLSRLSHGDNNLIESFQSLFTYSYTLMKITNAKIDVAMYFLMWTVMWNRRKQKKSHRIMYTQINLVSSIPRLYQAI